MLLCIILQMMDALDIVNSNLADATESWAVCRKQIETMQLTAEDPDDNSLLRTGSGDCSMDISVPQTCNVAVLGSLEHHAINVTSDEEHVSSIHSDALANSSANEILCRTADIREMGDKSNKSNSKCTGSSVKVSRSKSAVTQLFSDAKHQPSTTLKLKNVVGPQKNISKTPIKTENITSSVRKVRSNIIPLMPSLTSRGSFDLNSSRSSAPSSSRVNSKQVDSTFRQPSVPKRPMKELVTTGGSRQQGQPRRKLSAASAPSCSSLPDQKTTSESSLAAGDFAGDLPAAVSLRSSTPVTSSLGDSNDPSSISRVSSVSDASSPSASHGSSSAFSSSVSQSSKPSTSTGRLRHLLLLY